MSCMECLIQVICLRSLKGLLVSLGEGTAAVVILNLVDWRLLMSRYLYCNQTSTQMGRGQSLAHRQLGGGCLCCLCQWSAHSKNCKWFGWASDQALTESLAGCQLAPFYAYWHFLKAKTTEVFDMEPRCIIFFL